MTTSPGAGLKRSDLLVLGYGGTLRARDPSCQLDECWVAGHLLSGWLDRAVGELVRRADSEGSPNAGLLRFSGEPIPLGGPIAILEQRLLGLAAQAIGSVPSVRPFKPDEVTAHADGPGWPVLRHLLRSAVADWISATLVFLERLRRDHTGLAAALGVERLPPVQSLSGCASDAHAGGHSVLRVEFAGGVVIFYKPRPVSGEWLWRGLLDAVVEQDPSLNLPAMRVLNPSRNLQYGWADAVEPVGSGEVHRASYWRRAGAVLCLAQHVRMSDLHMANVFATAHGPAVVDAECLGSPRWGERSVWGRAKDALGFASAYDSLCATGLLPGQRIAGRFDASGLFGRSGDVAGVTLPCWKIEEDGRIEMTECAAELMDQRNAPEQTMPLLVLPHLVEGYRHAAEVLIYARRRLLAGGSRWRSVLEGEHRPRIVLRETLTYGLWISRSLAPEYLGSAARRRAGLLATMRAESHGLPPSDALLRAESKALLQGQIPRFFVEPGRRALLSGGDRCVLSSFCAEPGNRTVLRDLEGLSRERVDEVLVPALLAVSLRG